MAILLFFLLLLTVNVSAQPLSMEMSVERESSAVTPEATSQEAVAPAEIAPVETAPVETAPVETAPVETAPVETAPVETAPVEMAPAETSAVETAPATEAFALSDIEEQMLRNSFRTLALIPQSTIAGIALEDLQPADLKIVPADNMVTVFLPEYSIMGFNLGDFAIRYTVLDDKNIEFSWVMPKALTIEEALLLAEEVTAVGTWNADFGAASNFYLYISGLQLMVENTLLAEIAEINFNSEAKATGEGQFDLRYEIVLQDLQVPGKFSVAEVSYFEAAGQGPSNYQILDAYDSLLQIMASEELGEDIDMVDASAMLTQFAGLFPKSYDSGMTFSNISATTPMLPEIQLENFTVFAKATDLDAKSNYNVGYELSGLVLPAGLIPDNFLPFVPEKLRLNFAMENLSLKPLILIAANALSRELPDEETNFGLMVMRLMYKVFADQAAVAMEAEILAKEFSSMAKAHIALNGEAFYLSTIDAQVTMRGLQALAAQLPAEAQAELLGPMMMMTMLAKEVEKDYYQATVAVTADGAVLLNGEEQPEMADAFQELFDELLDEMDF